MKNIAYTSSGVWEFFVENNILMCYNPIKCACEKIDECDENDFDVSVCENGKIYVMLQKNNSFFLCRYDGIWRSECILDSNTDESYYKNIVLISNNDWLNAFYILKHNKKHLLIHHILGSRVSPEVVAESESEILFSVTRDEKRNIYIAYNSGNKIKIARYVWKNKARDEAFETTTFEGELKNISIEVTDDYKPVVCMCCKNDSGYDIVTSDKNTLISGIQKELFPCVVKQDKNTTCIFEYYGKILESAYINEKWQRVHYIHSEGFEKQHFVKISGPVDFDKTSKNFTYTYGGKNARGLFSWINYNLSACKIYSDKIKSVREADNVEAFAGIKKDIPKDNCQETKELQKTAGRDDTCKMLMQIANRLSNMENILFKVANTVNELNNRCSN